MCSQALPSPPDAKIHHSHSHPCPLHPNRNHHHHHLIIKIIIIITSSSKSSSSSPQHKNHHHHHLIIKITIIITSSSKSSSSSPHYQFHDHHHLIIKITIIITIAKSVRRQPSIHQPPGTLHTSDRYSLPGLKATKTYLISPQLDDSGQRCVM